MVEKRGSPTEIASILQQRISARLERFKPGDTRIREALTRIGILLESQMKLNVRRNRLIDTGNLINSIRYQLFQRGDIKGVEVGSFGVPYASVHEFGFRGVQSVREHTRTVTQAFGRSIPPRTAQVRSFSRTMHIRARPYMKPALRQHKNRITDILRQMVSGGRP